MVFEPRGGAKVLVAHESRPIATRIAVALQQNGMSPVHAIGGEAAMRVMSTEKPRAAVLDVALSGIMSFEIIERIRSSDDFRMMPVILVASVFNRTAYKRTPTSLYGADDYVEQHHVHDFLPRKLCSLLKLPEPPATTSGDDPAPVSGQDTFPELKNTERVALLARSIVTDIALYYQEEITRAASGELSPKLQNLLNDGRTLLADMVPGVVLVNPDPIQQAFDILLANVHGIVG